jgi:trans-aconitate 2-methyltransferase
VWVQFAGASLTSPRERDMREGRTSTAGGSMNHDSWSPAQYDRFKRERQQPFFDLLSMVDPQRGMHVLDLGCGTGELTGLLHEQLHAAHTLGIDRSPSMLERAAAHATSDLAFEQRDIEMELPPASYNLIFSNAALHWVPDHPRLLRRLTTSLRPGAQLAVQVPANHDQPTHTVAARVAASEPFRSDLDGYVAPVHVLEPDEYARLLFALGYVEQRVEVRVYGHVLDGPEEVVEWVKGTTLTVYKERLTAERYGAFLDAYGKLLLEELEDRRPYFFPFKRILFWARRS